MKKEGFTTKEGHLYVGKVFFGTMDRKGKNRESIDS
jgi:hypothetical protein